MCGLGLLGVLVGAGCGSATQPGTATELQRLRDQIINLNQQLSARQEQVREQALRIQELQGLSGERTLDRLVHVRRIEMDRLSGGYDVDRDGVHEGVVVYLRLLDAEQGGDAVKAAGSVRVRLLDLARPPESQTIGEIHLSPEQLRPLWYGRFLTSHYAVRVPWAGRDARPTQKTITVLVYYTDLLTGQTFNIQGSVEVQGLGVLDSPSPVSSSAPA